MAGLVPFWSQVVINRACEMHGITREEFLSPSRLRIHTRPRFAAAYTLRFFGLSYPAIARKIGRKDHSTAIHAVSQAANLCRYEDGYTDMIEELFDAACPGSGIIAGLPRSVERLAA